MLKKSCLYVLGLVVALLTSCEMLPMDEVGYYEEQFDMAASDFYPLNFQVLAENGGVEVFRWSLSDQASEYQIQISSDESFDSSSLILNLELSSANYRVNINQFESGLYYWRVRAGLPDGLYSQWFPSSFIVKPNRLIDDFEYPGGSFSLLQDWEILPNSNVEFSSSNPYQGENSLRFSRSGSYNNTSSIQSSISVEEDSYISMALSSTDYRSSSGFNVEIGGTTVISETGEFDWRMAYGIVPQGEHPIVISFIGPTSNRRGFLDNICINPLPMFTNIDFEDFTLGQDLPESWQASYPQGVSTVDTQSSQGSQSLKIESYSTSYNSSVSIIGKIDKDCFVSFDSMFTESLSDLEVYVDLGDYYSHYLNPSIENSWISSAFFLEQGRHVIQWVFDPRYSSDSLYLDNIRFIPVPERISIVEPVPAFVSGLNESTAHGDSMLCYPEDVGPNSGSLVIGKENQNQPIKWQLDFQSAQNSCLIFQAEIDSSSPYYTMDVQLNGTSEIDVKPYTNWNTYYLPVPAGANTVEWIWDSTYYGYDRYLSVKSINFVATEVFQDEDFESSTTAFSDKNSWFLGGYSLPIVQTMDAHGGSYSVRLGEEDVKGSSSLTAFVELAQSCTLSFWFKKSSGSDDFYFKVDGVTEYNRWYSNASWENVTRTIPAGSHILSWELTESSSIYNNSEVYLDDITLTP